MKLTNDNITINKEMLFDCSRHGIVVNIETDIDINSKFETNLNVDKDEIQLFATYNPNTKQIHEFIIEVHKPNAIEPSVINGSYSITNTEETMLVEMIEETWTKNNATSLKDTWNDWVANC